MKSRSSEIRRARPLLGTLVEIGAEGANAAAGIEAAFGEIETIHRLMSFHEENSDVSRINRARPGEILRIDHRTYEVLRCAQEMSRLSSGAFDVTVGGRLVEEGFLPRPANTASFDGEASFHDLVLLPDSSITLTRRAWIDLGGIAKGCAVDQGVRALNKHGVGSGIVNAGGDLYVFGVSQPIHIRHPANPSLLFPLGAITDLAVASSSGCFADGGEKPEPLVDGRRRACMRWKHGITVIASLCMIADALTKVVRLAPRRAPMILAHFSARAVIVAENGVRFFSDDRNRQMRRLQAHPTASSPNDHPGKLINIR
ncbi:MAG TPA: FAD:protein FMN transferase [Candidatus Binatia bacterium]